MRLLAASLLATSLGCVAPPAPSQTLWQRLGLPPAARLLGLPNNRYGKADMYPGSPSGTEPGKTLMANSSSPIRSGSVAEDASIGTSSNQRLAAIATLAASDGDCPNQDPAVEQALLQALDDDDAAVKLAAIEAIEQKVSNACQCGKCVEINGCSQDLLMKLGDLATGTGVPSAGESVESVRIAAARVVDQCRSSRRTEVRRVPRDRSEADELPTVADEGVTSTEQTLAHSNPRDGKRSDVQLAKADLGSHESSSAEPMEPPSSRKKKQPSAPIRAFEVAYKLSDSSADDSEVLVIINKGLASKTGTNRQAQVPADSDVSTEVAATPAAEREQSGEPTDRELIRTTTEGGDQPQTIAQPCASKPIDGCHIVSNPESLVGARVINYRQTLGEVLIDLPDAFDLQKGWQMVVVDGAGKYSLGRIADCGGRRLLIALENLTELKLGQGEPVKIGLVKKQ